MNKTTSSEYSRLFLLEGLPEPLTRASAHIQIFDNYIPDTRLRLRTVRDPVSGHWTYILQQRIMSTNNATLKTVEIHLNEAEYAHFQQFEGTEIRKNRYFHEFDGRVFAFDVYLGELWGLNTARVGFATPAELSRFEPPRFATLEVTSDPFFVGENLVHRKFGEVRDHIVGSSGISSPILGTDNE